jgi:ferredoxin
MVARRLGAKEITILYRRSRAEMPAYPWEIAEAEEEGIHFYYQAAPVRAIGQNGRVTALECIRMELAEPDASGRRRPIPIPGSEFTIACDTLIAAVGQTVAYTFEGLAVSPRGTFQVNPVTLQTGLPGVFAGGDAVSGPASVVEAIAAGRRAAESIARYLCGENLAVGRTAKQPDVSGIEYYMPAQPVLRQRAEMPRLPLQKRPGFAEVALGFSQEQAVAEAQRCLSCGVCAECLACLRVCKPGAIQHNQTVEHLHLDVGAVIWADGDGHGVSSVSGSGVYVLQKDDLLEASVTAAQVIADIEAEARRAKSEELTTLHALRFTPHTPRIGVFVCRCGDEVDSVLDVDALVEAARSMPRVVHAQGLSFSCQPETAATIKEAVAGHGLNRVVLAACSCCSLDQVCYSCTYQRVRCKGYLERIGELCTILSPDTRHPLYLPVDFVNIREQCAWVHGDHPALAIAKAKRLIAAAIAKMRVTAVDVSSSLTTRYSVDPYRCRACGTCETVCELLAIRVGKANGRLVAKVDPALCRDCGTCVAHCPSGAITAGDLTDRQIAAMLVALLQE